MSTRLLNSLRDQKGLSLLSVMGTIAVLGVGTYAAISLTKMSKKGQESTTRKLEATSMTSIVETKLRSAFLDTKGTDGKLTQGLCSLVKVGSLDSQLSNVYLQLPDPKREPLFNNTILSRAFTGLKDVSGASPCQLKSKYGKCLEFDKNVDAGLGVADINLRKLEPVFEINIKPMFTNPAAAVTFQEANPDGRTQFDLKAIAFEYTIRTSYKSSTERVDDRLGRKFIQGFIWAGDVGVCEVGGKKVSLTANSFGDPNESTVFNLAGFRSDSVSKISSPPLAITLQNSQIRSGVRGGSLGSQFLTSRDTASAENPDSGPVFSSCNENLYRCPQLSAHDRRYQFMRHMIRARFQVPNQLTNTGNSVQIAPSVKFKNLKGQSINDSFAESFNIGQGVYTKGTDGWFYADINGSRVALRIGEEDSLVARLSDSSGSTESNNVCRRVCVPETNYNSAPNDHYTAIFGYRVNMSSVPSGAVTSFEVPSGPVACTACYMKNCDQFGLGTFGAMHAQPTEPLDAGLPECVRHENHATSFYETKNFDLGMSNGSQCVAGRLNRDDNSGFSLSARPCATDLPVMCFSFGKHMLARQVTLNNSTVQRAKFNDAYNVCYNLGRENIKKEPLRALLSQQGNIGATEMELLGINNANLEIPLDQRVDIVNFILQGSFIAPVGLNQEARLREFADREGEKPELMNNDTWMGLKTDSAGYVYAPAPKIAPLALDANVKWGLHSDGGGRLVVRKTSNSLYLSTNSLSDSDQRDDIGKKVALLFHTPRFKGITYVRSVKPYGDVQSSSGYSRDQRDKTELRVLCRKNFYPYELFVSRNRTDNFRGAFSLCRSENGMFLPPLTTTGWVTALQLAQPNNARHAFPAIWEASNFDPLWVNLVEDGGQEQMFLGNDFLAGTVSRFMDENGKFIEENFEGNSDKSREEKGRYSSVCFDRDKGTIEIRDYCGRGTRLLTKEEVMAATLPDNFYLRFMLKVALAGRTGNETIKLYQ